MIIMAFIKQAVQKARLFNRIAQLEAAVQTLKQENQKIMATQADFDARMTALDEATNSIASELEALKGQIAGQGLSADQEAAVLGTLDAKIAALKALGAPPPPTQVP